MIIKWNETASVTLRRWGIFFLVFSILLTLSIVPLKTAYLGEIRPAFVLMAVYYLTIIRPLVLPPVVVFFIGLLLDLIFMWPFGMNALLLVAVQWVTRGQHKFLYGQSFLMIWTGFILVAFGAGAIQWALFSLLNLVIIPVKTALAGFLLSVFLFPVIALSLSWFIDKAIRE